MYLIHLPLYVGLILVKLSYAVDETIGALFVGGFSAFALMIPLGIVSFVFACLQFARLAASPLKTAIIVKLCLIPWYVINFMICGLLVAGFLNPWLMLAVPILIGLEVFVTYVVMLLTGIHSITYTIKFLILHKIKPTAPIVIALIFHLIFCLDIVGAIMLNIEHKKLLRSVTSI